MIYPTNCRNPLNIEDDVRFQLITLAPNREVLRALVLKKILYIDADVLGESAPMIRPFLVFRF